AADKVLAAHKKFTALPASDKMDREVFSSAERELLDHIKELNALIETERREREVAKVQMTTSSVCGFCQQDVSQFPEVAKRNAELEARVNLADLRIKGAENDIEAKKVGIVSLLKFKSEDSAARLGVRGIEQYIELGEDTIPVTVTWKGEIPTGKLPDVAALKAELVRIKAGNDATIRSRAKLETLEGQLEKLAQRQASLVAERDKVETMDKVRFQQLVEGMSKAEGQLTSAVEDLAKLSQQITEREAAHRDALRDYELAMSRTADMRARLKE
ncbi:MAG: hypothetical protein WC322_06195, partial [Candidatus Paceibacterota bacterium]